MYFRLMENRVETVHRKHGRNNTPIYNSIWDETLTTLPLWETGQKQCTELQIHLGWNCNYVGSTGSRVDITQQVTVPFGMEL